MSLTEHWYEGNDTGTVCVHETSIWVLVFLEGEAAHEQPGWYLWGPDGSRILIYPYEEGGSNALTRFNASRAADKHVADAWQHADEVFVAAAEMGIPVPGE